MTQTGTRMRLMTRWAPWMVLGGMFVFFLWYGSHRVSQQDHIGDFRHFYRAGAAVWRGENPYLAGEKFFETDVDGKPVEVHEMEPLTFDPFVMGDTFFGTLVKSPEGKWAIDCWGKHAIIILPDDAVFIREPHAKSSEVEPGIIVATNTKPERNGYIYPPLIAFCYSPLTPLGMTGAARVVVVLNVLLLFGGLFFLAKAVVDAFGVPEHWDYTFILGLLMLLTCLLGWDKIKSEIQMLQTNAAIFFSWAVGFYLLRERPFWAGIALGFAFNVKYQVIGVIPYFLLRRNWKGAAGMLTGIAFWGMLPGVTIGFGREAQYLGQAFAGILRLVGIPVTGIMADVEPLASGFSVSIPSGLARLVDYLHLPLNPILLAGAIGLAWVGGMVIAYLRVRLPVFGRVRDPALLATEFAVLMGLTLAFSPQTNPRHTVLVQGIYAVGLAYILLRPAAGKWRWAIAAVLVLTCFGLSYPIGTADGGATGVALWWKFLGLPLWCVLVASTTVLITGIRASRPALQETGFPVVQKSPMASSESAR